MVLATVAGVARVVNKRQAPHGKLFGQTPRSTRTQLVKGRRYASSAPSASDEGMQEEQPMDTRADKKLILPPRNQSCRTELTQGLKHRNHPLEDIAAWQHSMYSSRFKERFFWTLGSGQQ